MKEDVEEITWQTYTGELTPKQEKTKEKVLKRLEKVSLYVSRLNLLVQFHLFIGYSHLCFILIRMFAFM